MISYSILVVRGAGSRGVRGPRGAWLAGPARGLLLRLLLLFLLLFLLLLLLLSLLLLLLLLLLGIIRITHIMVVLCYIVRYYMFSFCRV